MPKLAELDDLYRITYQKLSVQERLYYCERRLETAYHLLDVSIQHFDSFEKNKLLSLINAIKSEITELQAGEN